MPSQPVGAADALAAAIAISGRKGPPCTVKVFLDALSPTDRKVFDGAAMDKTVPLTALERAAKTMGHHVHADTWSRHRNQRCQCAR